MADRKEELISELYKRLVELPMERWSYEPRSVSKSRSLSRYSANVETYIIRFTQSGTSGCRPDMPVLEIFQEDPSSCSPQLVLTDRSVVPVYEAVSRAYHRHHEGQEKRQKRDQELALLEDLVKKL